MNIEIEMKN